MTGAHVEGRYTRHAGLGRTYEYRGTWSLYAGHVLWNATVWEAGGAHAKGRPHGVLPSLPGNVDPAVRRAIEHAIEHLQEIVE